MNSNSPFRKADSLLSPGERAFFPVLEKAVAGRWEIHSQVRLEALTPVAEHVFSKQRYRNQVQSKAVDFVLCRHEDHAPVLVLEWDDWRHEALADRRERDELVDGILHSVGLPILHIRAQSACDPAALEQQILEKVFPSGASHLAPTISMATYEQQSGAGPDTRPHHQQKRRLARVVRIRKTGMALLGLAVSTALTLLAVVLLWGGVISALQSVGARFPSAESAASPTSSLLSDQGKTDSDADAIVATTNLNMRSGPDREVSIVGTYPEGTPLKVLGKDPTEYWLKVMTPDGKTGWMSGRFLRLTIRLSDVPVITK